LAYKPGSVWPKPW